MHATGITHFAHTARLCFKTNHPSEIQVFALLLHHNNIHIYITSRNGHYWSLALNGFSCVSLMRIASGSYALVKFCLLSYQHSTSGVANLVRAIIQ